MKFLSLFNVKALTPPPTKDVSNSATNEITALKRQVSRLRGPNHVAYREEEAYRLYKGKRLINIGAGTFHHRYWTNLDVSSDHYDAMRKHEHVEYNIMTDKALPFEDESVALAYTSHTIEHVKDNFIQDMFVEVYRTLEPGGMFRITCPDADLFYHAMKLDNFERFFCRRKTWFEKHGFDKEKVDGLDYLKMAFATAMTSGPIYLGNDQQKWNEIKSEFLRLEKEAFLDFLTSQVDFSINRIGAHINWWTHKKAESFLRRAGFNDIRYSSYGGSLAAPMCDINHFDNTHPDESLYVEAYK
ncbi:methyltransferase domain-containing protein [Roseibium aggregatum]|uniref:methyltransferase domain-containing protein n=1 Tax=Roseibium aggregatum TaxID=187304 RepID=UPI001A8FD932|nr:methyltransferase domain-containing protein [Roseibium aggregatum]MBN8180044.1 methyltransferase domain-containing protein [Roseibium aggregatum]UES45793.1 methyltransferase domain-containing protein [Roseibium aggregatum]